MRLYTKLNTLSKDTFHNILEVLFSLTDKVNIYFPNEETSPLIDLKAQFLNITELAECNDEVSALEEREGYSMIIAALTAPVKDFILHLTPPNLVSYGLIIEDRVVFYLSEEGECVIEMNEDELKELQTNPVFSDFKLINE